jgi:DNA-binding MarR family transcriptional regulator
MKPIASESVNAAESLKLERFLPYRLSVLANRTSRSLARVYAERFRLSVPQWRVMAVLADTPELSANQVAERTEMDKVMVSRAVAGLLKAKRALRTTARDDRRRSVLRLSERGLAVYREIVPLARAYEAELLAQLAPEERAALDRLLAALSDRALSIER